MTEMLSSGSEESQSDDSQETCHREPEKGDSPNPNRPTLTFGELLEKMAARGWESEESDTSELTTPERPTGSSDPSTTTWEVLMIPKKPRRMIRKDSSQDSSADPQQQAQE